MANTRAQQDRKALEGRIRVRTDRRITRTELRGFAGVHTDDAHHEHPEASGHSDGQSVDLGQYAPIAGVGTTFGDLPAFAALSARLRGKPQD